VKRNCNPKSVQECWQCGGYYCSHSLRYNQSYQRKVIEISCSVGLNVIFDEDGKRIND